MSLFSKRELNAIADKVYNKEAFYKDNKLDEVFIYLNDEISTLLTKAGLDMTSFDDIEKAIIDRFEKEGYTHTYSVAPTLEPLSIFILI